MTPNGAEIYVRSPNGDHVVVTAGVQALYDLVIDSMDWGSGFLTVEDATPVVEIAKLCGFERSEEAAWYVATQTQSEEQNRFLRNLRSRGIITRWESVEHDHVWSSVGRCMWPMCDALEAE